MFVFNFFNFALVGNILYIYIYIQIQLFSISVISFIFITTFIIQMFLGFCSSHIFKINKKY